MGVLYFNGLYLLIKDNKTKQQQQHNKQQQQQQNKANLQNMKELQMYYKCLKQKTNPASN